MHDMIVIGIDPHKATHTAVAVNQVARPVGQVTVAARDHGHLRLLDWARKRDNERLWAIEDCRHVSGRLERMLLANGERVVRVPPKLMGRVRREARSYGKSDPIDATAVARAALREPDLAVATLNDDVLEVRLLVDRREDLVAERTREICRLQWHLHDLDPDLDLSSSRLRLHKHVRATADHLEQLNGVRARVAAEILERIDVLNHRILAYAREITEMVTRRWPSMLDIDGCGALTAAKLIGEIGDPRRFATPAQLAMHAGTAPLPVSSGNTTRVRLNRRGNRQLNVAFHRIAHRQSLQPGSRGRLYLDRKIAEGKTRNEAMRCLKRQLTNTVYRALRDAFPEQRLT